MNFSITFDYELYGDGSGNVFSHIIHPTRHILEICAANNIRCTIFFEVIEYLKLKKEWNSGNKMGYSSDPIMAIEEQLITAAKAGHDIQLHVHPQWVDSYYSSGQWYLDFSNWRLGDFKLESGYNIKDLLKDGKEAIETLIQSVLPEYTCIALRAGGYNVMPSREVYSAMKEVGLKVDSSIYPGGYETGKLSQYDYRNVSLDKGYWWVNKYNFSEEGVDEILEIPVFALPRKRYMKFTMERIKSVLRNRNSAVEAVRSKTAKKSAISKIKYYFEEEALTWDFCLFNYSLHRYFFSYIEKELLGRRENFVLIGHPKNFTSDSAFKKMILYAKRNDYQFLTLKEMYENLSK